MVIWQKTFLERIVFERWMIRRQFLWMNLNTGSLRWRDVGLFDTKLMERAFRRLKKSLDRDENCPNQKP